MIALAPQPSSMPQLSSCGHYWVVDEDGWTPPPFYRDNSNFIVKIVEIWVSDTECPGCGGQGWYAEYSWIGSPPEQIQCGCGGYQYFWVFSDA